MNEGVVTIKREEEDLLDASQHTSKERGYLSNIKQ